MRVFIGMETSGVSRRSFAAMGHDVISCDVLPADPGYNLETDGASEGRHIVGDVFAALDDLRRDGWWPDFALFHPTCTMHTLSAAWAFADPDYERYPGVGYHQRVQPGTPVGAARRLARQRAELDIERIARLPIHRKAMENPRGTISTRTALGRPQQVLQPYMFGDDASKATCLWEWNLPPIHIPNENEWVKPRIIDGKPRWSNQTDSGQNRLSPSEDRWKDRSRTYPGIADAIVANWGSLGGQNDFWQHDSYLSYGPLQAIKINACD